MEKRRVININFFDLRIPVFFLFFLSLIYSFVLSGNIFRFPDIILLNLGFILLIFIPLKDIAKVLFSLWLSFFILGFSVLRISIYSLVRLSDINFLISSFALILISFCLSFALVLLFKYRLEEKEFEEVGKSHELLGEEKRKSVFVDEQKYEFFADQVKRRIELLSEEIETDIKIRYRSILKKRDEIFKSIELNKKELAQYHFILHKIHSRIIHEIEMDKEFKKIIDSFLGNISLSFANSFLNALLELNKLSGSVVEVNFAKTPISSLEMQQEGFNIQVFKDKIEEFNRSNLLENLILIQKNFYGLKAIFHSFQKIMQDFSRVPHTCYSISIKVLQIASSSGDSDVRRKLSAIVQDIDSFSFKVAVNIRYVLDRMKDFEVKLLLFSEAFDLDLQKFHLISVYVNDIGSRYIDIARKRFEFFNEQYERILGEAGKFLELGKEMNLIFLKLKEALTMGEDIKNRISSITSSQWLILMRKQLDNRIQTLSNIILSVDKLLKDVSGYIEDINSITLPDILIHPQSLKSDLDLQRIKKLFSKFGL